MKIIYHQKNPLFHPAKKIDQKPSRQKTSQQKNFFAFSRTTPKNSAPMRHSDKKTSPFILSWEVKIDKRLRIFNSKFLFFLFALFVFLIGFGLFTENYLFSILVILAGLIFYLFENENPKPFLFGITSEGIVVDNQLYEFNSLESFWIFYEPKRKKEIIFKRKNSLLPPLKIPLGKINPVKARKTLINFLPEKKQKEGFFDLLEDLI